MTLEEDPARIQISAAPIERRVQVITLAVEDLERALAFYRGLGLESPGIVAGELMDAKTGANGAIAPFMLEGGLMLSLYPRTELAKDAGIAPGPGQSGEFSLGQIVGSRDEVDAILAKAEASGAPITEVHERPWGIYSGYFRDPDGHLWEIIHNPNASSPNEPPASPVALKAARQGTATAMTADGVWAAADLFAGIAVTDFAAALPWYEQLLGSAPSMFPHDTEAVWQLGEHRLMYIVQRPDRAGHATHTLMVGDLDVLVAGIAQRGLEPAKLETYSNGVRKFTYTDPDGNEIAFGAVPR